MKTIFLLTMSLIFAGCAINHKRGADAQATVDYYLQNRGPLPREIAKLITLKGEKEASVTIQWTVTDTGTTKDINILNDTLHNSAVNTVLIDHLKTMNFPKTPRFTSSTVEYTYTFRTQ